MRPRRWTIPLVALICAALLAGCVGSNGGAPGDPRSGDGLKYGLAPKPDKGVTFQKDVVLVQGGASSVRSVTSDGLTWTLSPSAGGIGDLSVGRVMFLTDRAVGRVVAIQNTSAGVEVTMAPVDITDVISDGDFSKNDVAISNPVAISGHGAFWADPDVQQQAGVGQSNGADLPALARSGGVDAAPFALPRPPAPPAIVSEVVSGQTGAFGVKETCCTSGPGAKIAYDKNGLKLSGSLGLSMAKPTANFQLKISGGSIDSTGLTVRGAAKIVADLKANAAPNSAIHGFSPPLGLDFAFSVPIGLFFGVPLNMVVSQHFGVEVNIPGTAQLLAHGELNLGSTIGFSYAGGKFRNTTTATFDPTVSLKATDSIAVGISYAVFDYNVRFTVGFGLLGFVAGVYLALGLHVMATVGAPFGSDYDPNQPIEHCRSVQASLFADYGVGYTIPKVVADVTNFFLKAFHSDPIPASGGLSNGWQPIKSAYSYAPQVPLCKQN
ncbi:MAG TPA: hypothetical protein VGM70_11865 [Pseudolysinimonas sp.]|jgi:hypothetical protein